ncbi:MAG: Calx-beta domain-containing protein [Acidimicrobiales bacterium]|nr:Calx-beta domain-containing protein [Acidimicrobiales bacterium]
MGQLTRNKTMGIFIVIIIMAGLVMIWQWTGDDNPDESSEIELLVDTVSRQTLRDELTLNGELRRDELQAINSPFDGRVSQIAVNDGDQIAPGDVILALDGRPAVAANGDFSFYRRLDVGSDGPDVLQLEQILRNGGYDPGNVDGLYTEDTRRALRQWQVDYGYGGATPEPEETIVITLTNGNGYTVGNKDSKAIRIGPSVPSQLSGASDGNLPSSGMPVVPAQVMTPAIGVTLAEDTVAEGNTLDVVLTASPAPDVDTQINLTFGGDAIGGDLDDVADPDIDVDYLDDPLEETPIVWPAGETTLALTLEVLADDLDEDDESWTISVTPENVIGEGTNYDVAPINTMTVTIIDSTPDQIPQLSVNIDDGDDEIEEGEDAVFTIVADDELGRDVEVGYMLIGSAQEGDDYPNQDDAPSVLFPAGENEITVTVPTLQDDQIEPIERITLSLQPATDGEYTTADPTTGTVTIEDEDDPELTIVGGEVTVPEGGAVVFSIRADEAPSRDISVDYQVGGTATMGVDFQVLTGTVTFPAGRTQVDVIINTIDDDVIFVPSDMIIADWPARVGTVFVDEGETVQLGRTLLNLTEPEFTINLIASPSDRSELVLGQAVTVEIEAGDQSVAGTITELDDAATITDGGAERYEGVVEPNTELFAVDGATVRIEVVLDERIDAIVVPRAAIYQNATGETVVRVIDLDTGAQTEVIIETGIQEGSFTEVVRGLAGGEQIVVDVTGG